MSVVAAKCPYCGNTIDAETERVFGICPHCNLTYNTQNAISIVNITDEETQKLVENREALRVALAEGDLNKVRFASRSICNVIGGDFLGNYYYSYAAKEKGNPFYYVDYLKLMDNEIGTPEEQEEVLNHLIAHANLNDCQLIDEYIERTVTNQADYISWLKKLKKRQADIKQENNYKLMKRECYICYAPSELDVALEVASVLESLNIRCFIKDRNIDKSKATDTSIEEGIQSCRMVILIASNRSLLASNIKEEMVTAMNKGLKFIEFKIDESKSDIAFKYAIPVENKIETCRRRGEFYGVLINTVRKELVPNNELKARYLEMINAEKKDIEEQDKLFVKAAPQKSQAQSVESMIENVVSLINDGKIDKADALADELMQSYKNDYRSYVAKVRVCTKNFTNIEDTTHRAFLKQALAVANQEQSAEVVDLYATYQAYRFKTMVENVKLDANHYDECLDVLAMLEDEYNYYPQETKDKISVETYEKIDEARKELENLYNKKREEQKYSDFAKKSFFETDGDTLLKYTGRNAMVQIPDGIKVIGEGCFQGLKSLKTISIPYGVTAIRDSAFSDCSNLESIELPDTLVELGDDVFSNCEIIREVKIPSGVTRVGYRSFYNCSNLGIVSLGDNVTEIAGLAFSNCSSLYSINIPSTVKLIAKSAFSQCTSLQNITLPEGLEEIKTECFYHCTRLENITIPEGVKTICQEAFSGCTRLLSVKFQKTLEVIGRRSFLDCAKLRTINLPKSLLSIEEQAFMNCTGIKDLKFDPESLLQTIEKEAFYGCENIVSLNLPKQLTKISEGAFYNLKKCEEIVLPPNLERIEKLGLYGFESLLSLTIPASCKFIGEKALYGGTINTVYIRDKEMYKEFKKQCKAEFYQFAVELDK